MAVERAGLARLAGVTGLNDLQVDVENYTEQIVSLLWPGSADADRAGAVRPGMLALPSVRRARLLVPAAHRKVAANAVRRYSVHGDAQARISTAALAAGLRTGAAAAADPAPVLDARGDGGAGHHHRAPAHDRLARTARSRSTSACRAATASRCCSSASRTARWLAVAKLGVSALSSRLIRNEAAALTRLAAAPLESRHRPRACSSRATGARFRCSCSRRCPSSARTPPTPLRVANRPPWRSAVLGGIEMQRLAASPVLDVLDQRVAALPDSAERDLAVRTRRATRRSLPTWNCPSAAGTATGPRGTLAPSATRGMLVWDWERFSSGVPVGYDALHYSGQVGAGRAGWSRRRASRSPAPNFARSSTRSASSPTPVNADLRAVPASSCWSVTPRTTRHE